MGEDERRDLVADGLETGDAHVAAEPSAHEPQGRAHAGDVGQQLRADDADVRVS